MYGEYYNIENATLIKKENRLDEEYEDIRKQAIPIVVTLYEALENYKLKLKEMEKIAQDKSPVNHKIDNT